MPGFSTVIFDLDGTLTDPKVGITTSIQYALRALGRPVPANDALTWCIGPPLIRSFETLVGASDAERALALYRERFGTVGLYENEVFDGIPALLADLAARHRLYVATSKPHVFARPILRHFKLDGHFVAIEGSELDGTRVHKDELLAHMLALHDIDPEDAVMIGDREHDVLGAAANGIPALGVLYGYGSEAELSAAGARALCRRPHDIPDALAGLHAARRGSAATARVPPASSG